MNNLNIACVLYQQSQAPFNYSIEWVDKLYHNIRKNLDISFNFFCFSNLETSYQTVPLSSESDGFWNKIELFQKNVLVGPTLYLDLDVVICKNITETILKLPQDKFLMIEEPYRNIHNSSVMFWNGDYSYLYDSYVGNKQDIIKEYSDTSRLGCLGDQAYISENTSHELIENYAPAHFIGWQHHKINTELIDPTILIFTGKQKPSNNLDLSYVRDHWQ